MEATGKVPGGQGPMAQQQQDACAGGRGAADAKAGWRPIPNDPRRLRASEPRLIRPRVRGGRRGSTDEGLCHGPVPRRDSGAPRSAACAPATSRRPERAERASGHVPGRAGGPAVPGQHQPAVAATGQGAGVLRALHGRGAAQQQPPELDPRLPSSARKPVARTEPVGGGPAEPVCLSYQLVHCRRRGCHTAARRLRSLRMRSTVVSGITAWRLAHVARQLLGAGEPAPAPTRAPCTRTDTVCRCFVTQSDL